MTETDQKLPIVEYIPVIVFRILKILYYLMFAVLLIAFAQLFFQNKTNLSFVMIPSDACNFDRSEANNQVDTLLIGSTIIERARDDCLFYAIYEVVPDRSNDKEKDIRNIDFYFSTKFIGFFFLIFVICYFEKIEKKFKEINISQVHWITFFILVYLIRVLLMSFLSFHNIWLGQYNHLDHLWQDYRFIPLMVRGINYLFWSIVCIAMIYLIQKIQNTFSNNKNSEPNQTV